LVLQFSEFSTIFYTFYKFLQNCITIEDVLLHRDPQKDLNHYKQALGLLINPQKETGPRNWVLGRGGTAGSPESRRLRPRSRAGSGSGRAGAHLGPIGGRGWGKRVAGAGVRRRPVVVAAAARSPARRRLGLDKVWAGRAKQELGEALSNSHGAGVERSKGLGGGANGGRRGEACGSGWRGGEGRAGRP
jgi:hypothetical protein